MVFWALVSIRQLLQHLNHINISQTKPLRSTDSHIVSFISTLMIYSFANVDPAPCRWISRYRVILIVHRSHSVHWLVSPIQYLAYILASSSLVHHTVLLSQRLESYWEQILLSVIVRSLIVYFSQIQYWKGVVYNYWIYNVALAVILYKILIGLLFNVYLINIWCIFLV